MRINLTLRQERLAFVALLLTVTSCGSLKESSQYSNGPSNSSGDSTAASELISTPPQAYYNELLSSTLALLGGSGSGASAATPATVWVNFGGGTVTQGYQTGQSFLLCQASAVLPAATALTAAEQAQIVAAVQQFYTAAGANLAVTATQPKTGAYKTVEVGGSLSVLGCPDFGQFGAAPLDIGNANPSDIAFVFTAKVSDPVQLGVNIAHVSAHTFGLQNVTNTNDVMATLPLATATGFADGTVAGTGADQNEPVLLQEATGIATSAGGGSGGTLVISPASGAESVVAEVASFLPLGANNIGQLLPLLTALLPAAAQLDPAAVDAAIVAAGLGMPMAIGSGSPAAAPSTGTAVATGTTPAVTTTVSSGSAAPAAAPVDITVNVNITNDVTNITNVTETTTTTVEGNDGSHPSCHGGSGSSKPASTTTTTTVTSTSSGTTTSLSPVASAPATGTVATASATGTVATAPATGTVVVAPVATAAASGTGAAAVSARAPCANPQAVAALITSIQPLLLTLEQNFSGADLQALLTLLKAGYLEKYLNLL